MPAGHDPAPARRPLVTPMLVGACAVWFLVWLPLAEHHRVPAWDYLTRPPARVLQAAGAASGPTLALGDGWRLGTSPFVHGGLIHLLVNLSALAAIGPAVEEAFGRRRAATIAVVAATAGGCLALGLRPQAVLCGASGLICGLLAAMVVWLRRNRRALDPADARAAGRRLGLVVVVGIGVSLLPGVSWEGHLGGAVGGALAAVLLERRRWLLTLLLLLGCIGGLLAAVVYAPNWRPVCRQAAAASVAPIHPVRANAVAQDAMVASVAGVRPKGLTTRAEVLATAARRSAAGWVPAPELVRARAYARAVQALAEAAAADTIDPDAVRAHRQAVREAWAALNG